METLTPDNLSAFAKAVVEAVQSGKWQLVAALALVAVTWVFRKYGAKKFPWLATQDGGAVLVLVTGFAGGILTVALGGGNPFTWAIAAACFKVSFTAAGGWTLVKHLLKAPFVAAILKKLGLGALTPVDGAAIKADAAAQGAAAAGAAPVKSPIDIVNGK